MSQVAPPGSPDSSDPVDRALRSLAALIRESPHNLLSPRGLDELETRHFPESLAFAASLPAGPRVLDIGSGGGIPGLVIAIARPDLVVHLLDSTRKKADFLAAASDDLGLDVAVHHGRAEELAASDLGGSFDVVTARAVAPMDRLVTWAAPFLRAGGTLHAIKGDRWRDELEAATGSIRTSGLEVLHTPAEQVPDSMRTAAPRVIVLRRAGTGERSGKRRPAYW